MSSARLTKLLQPLIEDLGYEFVGLEQSSNPKNPVVVIYIDHDRGIAIEDCEKVSREVAALLDVEDPIPGQYSLEVSSPGLDRPVGKLNDFMRFMGHRAKIRLATAVQGRQNFTGVLAGVIEEMVQLQVDDETVSLNFKDISRARLINYNGER